jgi:N-acetylmuramoyl-L-alanine amidase
MSVKRGILDPGHGGIDHNGNYTTFPNKMHTFPDGRVAYEGVINRNIAQEIYDNLRCEGDFLTLFTVRPEDPTDMKLSRRVYFANTFPAKDTLFISLHCNASPNHNAGGGEVWTSPGQTKSDVLAGYIYVGMQDLYRRWNMRMRPDLSDGDYDREARFQVLTNTKCPAVLIEFGFFDYLPDLNNLENIEFQKQVGKVVAKDIIKYIQNETD